MDADQAGSSRGKRQSGVQSDYLGSAFDFAQRSYDSNWAYQGTMQEAEERNQPPTFTDWPQSSQSIFDQHTYMGASMGRILKKNYDHQEQLTELDLMPLIKI